MRVDGLVVENADVAQLLSGVHAAERERLFVEILTLGARGMSSLALNATVENADARFEASLQRAVDQLHRVVAEVIDTTTKAVDQRLDPDLRSSVMGRAIAELSEARGELVDQFDLRRSDSHSSQLVDAINAMVGPAGNMERLLAAALDPNSEQSAFSGMAAQLESGFAELRDLMMRQDGARSEAERGTAKGLRYEEIVDRSLRRIARNIGTCVVDATGTETGARTSTSKVGDFVIENEHGHRVVVEAKNKTSLTLTGKTGILTELDRALENRQSHFAVCVSALDAFPTEVGGFGIYGNRLLVVDDGDGVLFEASIRWAFAQLAVKSQSGDSATVTAICNRIDRIRQHSGRLSAIKRSLSALKESVDRIHADIGVLQADLRSEFEEMDADIGRRLPSPTATTAETALRLVADD